MDKRISLEDAIAQIKDGMTVGIGGWGARRKPMTLVRSLCRSSVRDLTIVTYGGPDVGMLCSAGKVAKVVFGFVSLDVIPLDPHFRRARETAQINATELDEGMLYWGLYAASLRLPFLPMRAGLGSDVLRLNPEIQTLRSPYEDRELLVAMPAMHLDVALVHADRADPRGNALVLGPDSHFDDVFCGAAEQAIVSAEEIVPTDQLLGDDCLRALHLNRSVVNGVVDAPFGAHPTSCAPRYGIDKEHLRTYAESVGDGWSRYRADFIDAGDYLTAVGGEQRVLSIPTSVF